MFANGSYLGHLNDFSEQEGFGLMMYWNGSVYKGNWKNGKREGTGRIIFGNGDFYRGSFKFGRFEGEGEYFFSRCKDRYLGNWKSGKMEGKGMYWNQQKQTVFQGEFYRNKKHGKGVTFHQDYTLTGQRNLGSKEGLFYLTDRSQSCTYKIRFRNDKKEEILKITQKESDEDTLSRVSFGFFNRLKHYKRSRDEEPTQKDCKVYSCGDFSYCNSKGNANKPPKEVHFLKKQRSQDFAVKNNKFKRNKRMERSRRRKAI